MNLITIDFETCYGKSLGFRTQTTEEYIHDPLFHVIGVGIQHGDNAQVWISGHGEAIKDAFDAIDWGNTILLCHNTLFDGAVLAWKYGKIPAFYLDTLCMARAIHGVDAGGSLAALAERYHLGQKGTEVIEAEGKKLEDFTETELAKYGEYCKNDVFLTYGLYQKLRTGFPDEELKLIDMTLRMFIQPVLEVDDAMLIDRLDALQEEKLQMLGSLKDRLNCESEEEVRARLASNKQFAELLEELGVEVPMKVSKTTGKDTFALAKNDMGFLDLQEHENELIQELCAVRLGTKSTIEESRILRFVDVGSRNKGKLPIPLKYYGAHTGRWAGMDKVNFQNLPSRDKKKKTLKNAVIAPDGHVVINCDSSQIEARVLVWLVGQDEVVKQFANGEDVYSLFASQVYDRPITKADATERFVGKTCILGLGYGTGAEKLKHTLATTPPFADVSIEDSNKYVDKYREVNDKVVGFWRTCDKALDRMMEWPVDENMVPLRHYYIGKNKAVVITPEGILLPNGLMIRYPKLHKKDGKVFYNSRKGEVSIWGGAVTENIVQALARIIVGHQMVKINERYRVVMTVHDAAVIVVPEDEVDEAMKFVTDTMSIPPEWATGLPVACEAKYATSYGEC